MAGYYTSFSVLLPVPHVENAEARMKDWIAEVGSQRVKDEESLDCEHGSANLEWDFHQKAVWLYEESEGDVEYAAELIQRYLYHFGLEGGVFMSWAGTCSKPRVNEAVGGGVVVTKDDMVWVNSYDAIVKAREGGVQILN